MKRQYRTFALLPLLFLLLQGCDKQVYFTDERDVDETGWNMADAAVFDVDVDDYTITLHYYDKPSDIPSNAINLGMSFYMYPCVEVVEPCYIGMCSIVQVFDTNYNKKYAIQAV